MYTVCPAPLFSTKSVPVVPEVIVGANSSTFVIENVTDVGALVFPTASVAVTVKL